MQQKVYGFLDNLIWIDNSKFSLLLREYSQLAVNLLTLFTLPVKILKTWIPCRTFFLGLTDSVIFVYI